MNLKLIPVGKAAELIGVSIQTLRRWDQSGKFSSVRKPSGHRYYKEEDIHDWLERTEKVDSSDIFFSARHWASSNNPIEPDPLFYCQLSSHFQYRLTKLEKTLGESGLSEDFYPFITAVVGEIGNNSFDHNFGNWPDIPGIFFGYNIKKRVIVLADRGRGILNTLRRVRPELDSDAEALKVAFTEVISGRAPEARGNGLKFVRAIVSKNDLKLFFQSGDAEVNIKKDDHELKVKRTLSPIRGCIALIKY